MAMRSIVAAMALIFFGFNGLASDNSTTLTDFERATKAIKEKAYEKLENIIGKGYLDREGTVQLIGFAACEEQYNAITIIRNSVSMSDKTFRPFLDDDSFQRIYTSAQVFEKLEKYDDEKFINTLWCWGCCYFRDDVLLSQVKKLPSRFKEKLVRQLSNRGFPNGPLSVAAALELAEVLRGEDLFSKDEKMKIWSSAQKRKEFSFFFRLDLTGDELQILRTWIQGNPKNIAQDLDKLTKLLLSTITIKDLWVFAKSCSNKKKFQQPESLKFTFELQNYIIDLFNYFSNIDNQKAFIISQLKAAKIDLQKTKNFYALFLIDTFLATTYSDEEFKTLITRPEQAFGNFSAEVEKCRINDQPYVTVIPVITSWIFKCCEYKPDAENFTKNKEFDKSKTQWRRALEDMIFKCAGTFCDVEDNQYNESVVTALIKMPSLVREQPVNGTDSTSTTDSPNNSIDSPSNNNSPSKRNMNILKRSNSKKIRKTKNGSNEQFLLKSSSSSYKLSEEKK